MMDDAEARERVARVESLLEQVDVLDVDARDKATALVQTVVELYGACLERIVELVAEDHALADAFAGDELIAHLLLVHDLHPLSLEQRVRRAIGKLDEDVELVGVESGVVRLRIASGCGTAAIEKSIREVAPDAVAIDTGGGIGLPMARMAG